MPARFSITRPTLAAIFSTSISLPALRGPPLSLAALARSVILRRFGLFSSPFARAVPVQKKKKKKPWSSKRTSSLFFLAHNPVVGRPVIRSPSPAPALFRSPRETLNSFFFPTVELNFKEVLLDIRYTYIPFFLPFTAIRPTLVHDPCILHFGTPTGPFNSSIANSRIHTAYNTSTRPT